MRGDRLLTPQQENFLAYYTNPKSETFSNASQSAVKAGYAQDYADNITAEMPEWLQENLGDLKRLRKAEKVLDETLEVDHLTHEGKVDSSILSVKNKTAMFVAERLNKGKYSSRQELTGKDGEVLFKGLSEEERYKLDTLIDK